MMPRYTFSDFFVSQKDTQPTISVHVADPFSIGQKKKKTENSVSKDEKITVTSVNDNDTEQSQISALTRRMGKGRRSGRYFTSVENDNFGKPVVPNFTTDDSVQARNEVLATESDFSVKPLRERKTLASLEATKHGNNITSGEIALDSDLGMFAASSDDDYIYNTIPEEQDREEIEEKDVLEPMRAQAEVMRFGVSTDSFSGVTNFDSGVTRIGRRTNRSSSASTKSSSSSTKRAALAGRPSGRWASSKRQDSVSSVGQHRVGEVLGIDGEVEPDFKDELEEEEEQFKVVDGAALAESFFKEASDEGFRGPKSMSLPRRKRSVSSSRRSSHSVSSSVGGSIKVSLGDSRNHAESLDDKSLRGSESLPKRYNTTRIPSTRQHRSAFLAATVPETDCFPESSDVSANIEGKISTQETENRDDYATSLESSDESANMKQNEKSGATKHRDDNASFPEPSDASNSTDEQQKTTQETKYCDDDASSSVYTIEDSISIEFEETEKKRLRKRRNKKSSASKCRRRMSHSAHGVKTKKFDSDNRRSRPRGHKGTRGGRRFALRESINKKDCKNFSAYSVSFEEDSSPDDATEDREVTEERDNLTSRTPETRTTESTATGIGKNEQEEERKAEIEDHVLGNQAKASVSEEMNAETKNGDDVLIDRARTSNAEGKMIPRGVDWKLEIAELYKDTFDVMGKKIKCFIEMREIKDKSESVFDDAMATALEFELSASATVEKLNKMTLDEFGVATEKALSDILSYDIFKDIDKIAESLLSDENPGQKKDSLVVQDTSFDDSDDEEDVVDTRRRKSPRRSRRRFRSHRRQLKTTNSYEFGVDSDPEIHSEVEVDSDAGKRRE